MCYIRHTLEDGINIFMQIASGTVKLWLWQPASLRDVLG